MDKELTPAGMLHWRGRLKKCWEGFLRGVIWSRQFLFWHLRWLVVFNYISSHVKKTSLPLYEQRKLQIKILTHIRKELVKMIREYRCNSLENKFTRKKLIKETNRPLHIMLWRISLFSTNCRVMYGTSYDYN